MTRDQSALVAGAAPALFADTLRRYGRVSLRATGRSMLPAIEPGDVLRVEHATADRIRPGDVILYDAGGRLIAHRCVRISVAAGVVGLVARGDSHGWTDPPISPAQVLGRVVGIPRCSAAGHVQGAVMRLWRSLRDRAASRAARATSPAGAR